MHSLSVNVVVCVKHSFIKAQPFYSSVFGQKLGSYYSAKLLHYLFVDSAEIFQIEGPLCWMQLENKLLLS